MFLLLAISILLLLPQIVLGGTTEKHRRWYGVRPLSKGKSMGQYGPWPLVCDGQSVRYCFADARSQKNLENNVNEAVARWAHATIHTSMRIIPDNEDSLLCSGPDIRSDALVISDLTKDNDKAWNYGPDCPTDSASTGYDYGSQERGRHRLDFCHLDPQDIKGTSAKAVVSMMHELGHAIGLQHENQRDDRDKYLKFKCEVLFGYKEAQHLTDIDERGHFDDDQDAEERMLLAYEDDDVASDYLPASLPFIRGMNHRLETQLPKWKPKAISFSKLFDYDSIMMYNSHANVQDSLNGSKPENWVLSRKDNGKPVWQGGSEDPAQAKITEGDIVRVAQLYPTPDHSSDGPAMWDKWGTYKAPKLRVRVRGLETIVEAPRPLQSVEEVSGT